jgi:hypothetical protein
MTKMILQYRYVSEQIQYSYVSEHTQYSYVSEYIQYRYVSKQIQYSYVSEQIHKHTAKNKDYKIIHQDNYILFLKIQTAEKHSGGYLTVIFGMQYLKREKLQHVDLCNI